MKCNLKTMLNPSRAKILRLDIKLVDCPGSLLEMGHEENGIRKQTFTEDDDKAVRKLLGRVDEKYAFKSEIDRYIEIERKYKFPVWGYGAFVNVKDLEMLYSDVESFNVELRQLRLEVVAFLRARYPHPEMDRRIMRFNPRVKIGTYLLPQAFVEDRLFQRSVEIACKKGKLSTSMPILLGICD